MIGLASLSHKIVKKVTPFYYILHLSCVNSAQSGGFMKLVLIIAALLSSIQVGFAANCSTIWANGFPDIIPRTTPVSCDQFYPTRTTIPSNQRLFTVSTITSNLAVKEQMDYIAEALTYATAKYSGYGRVPAITVIRQDIPHPNSGGTNTMAYTYVQFFNLDTESCPIFVYPLSEVLSKPHLQQLIAHEVFHCVQKMNFKDQVAYAVTTPGQSYWFEGLAQLFSNFVYPYNDFEYTARFPAPDQTVPFFNQPNAYSSENFWQSYANMLTEDALFMLMNQMPIAGAEAPATTVVNLPRISEALHNYAQQITLKQVRDASGAWSPYDMSFQQVVLTDIAHQEVSLFHADFTVGAYEITIPKGGKWTLGFTRPAETKVSMKKVEDLVYSAVDRPVVITSECDSERKIQVVITTAADNQSMNTTFLSVDKEANPDCGCLGASTEPQIDRCLIGTWNLDHSSVAQFWNRMNRNPVVQFNGSTGGFSVSFDEANIGTWHANSWNVAALGHMGEGMIMSMERITNGSSSFKYSANGSSACSKQVSSSLTAKVIMAMNGQTISTNDEPPMDPSNGVFTYSCNERQFIFKRISIHGNSMDMDYIFNRQ